MREDYRFTRSNTVSSIIRFQAKMKGEMPKKHFINQFLTLRSIKISKWFLNYYQLRYQ